MAARGSRQMMARPARVAMRWSGRTRRPPAACAWSYHRNASTSCMEPNTPRKSAWPRARRSPRDRRVATAPATKAPSRRSPRGTNTRAWWRATRRVVSATAAPRGARARDGSRLLPEETRRAGRRRRDRRPPRPRRTGAGARARTRAHDRRTRHRRDTRACECPAVVVAGETSRPSATIRSSRRGRHSCARTNCNKPITTNGDDDSEGVSLRSPRLAFARPAPVRSSHLSLYDSTVSRARSTPTLALVTTATSSPPRPRPRAFLWLIAIRPRDRPDDNLSRFRRRRRRRRRGHLLALGPDRRVLVHPRATFVTNNAASSFASTPPPATESARLASRSRMPSTSTSRSARIAVSASAARAKSTHPLAPSRRITNDATSPRDAMTWRTA